MLVTRTALFCSSIDALQTHIRMVSVTEPTRRAVHLERVYKPPWRDSQQEVALSVAVFSMKSNTVVPMVSV